MSGKTPDIYKKVIAYFQKEMPTAETELHFDSPFQFLVAVILSAQCTDKRVNSITPELFRHYPDAPAMAAATADEVFQYIKSCSYPNNKSKYLVATAQKLCAEYGGTVPDDIDRLQKLPGVGRKTANVVASVVFDKPAMPVDTHIFRVSARLGLTTDCKTPLQTERQLTQHIPTELLGRAHHWLLLHGRYVCTAIKPKCNKCGLKDICAHFGQTTENQHI